MSFQIGTGNVRHDPNIVIGTFLLNNQYILIPSDTSIGRNFISNEITSLLHVPTVTVNTSYTFEFADTKSIKTNHVIQRYTVDLNNYFFDTDFLPSSILEVLT